MTTSEFTHRSAGRVAAESAAQVADAAHAAYCAGDFPAEAINGLAKAGLLGMRAERSQGGLDLSTLDYAEALEEIARTDVTTALTVEVHTLASELCRSFGRPELKATWMPRFAAGTALSGVAITEPEAGSDLRAIATAARLDGDAWVLDGDKIFITNTGTPLSDGLLVVARTSERPEFGVFLVPAGAPGYRVGERIRTLGWRSMDTREISFTNCRIPRGHVIGDPAQGMAILSAGLAFGRVGFAAVATGLATACLEAAVAYGRQRVQFGRPVTSFQALAHQLADTATAIAAARALTRQAAAARDSGETGWQVQASMAKLFASRTAVNAADTAVQVFGARGFIADSVVARYYADAKMMEIGEGTSEMQRSIIARSLGC